MSVEFITGMEVRTRHKNCDLAHALWQFRIARHGLGVVPDRSPELWKGQPGIPGADQRAAVIDRLETFETRLNALLHIVIKGALLAFECLRRNKWKPHPISPAAISCNALRVTRYRCMRFVASATGLT